ncbi:MAG: penicillin-binding protein 1C, partial [Bacteroidota bacterium]|nr:penicillin-binding protein 1C [Bacteroidota bacterium]
AEDSTLLCAYLSDDDKWRMETRPEDVPPELITALLAKEDQYFKYHPGVNPFSIVRAAIGNIVSQKRQSGASTISMQLARLMNPGERNYGNKLAEMLRALQLEWRYPKRKILELYLSYLPYGGNIEGVKAASYLYFDRKPARLSLSQSILLTVIPNRPNSLRIDRPNDEAHEVRNKWIRHFITQNTFPLVHLRSALDEPIPFQRKTITPIAPHFSLFAKNQSSEAELQSTLSLPMQHKAERLLKLHVTRVKSKGISTGCVLVVENKSREIKAYCGSANFNDAASHGQVNGVKAHRSPGSTLKTALYLHAIDLGELTPGVVLLDLPTNINGYIPENSDLKYSGAVTATNALTQSLNIPAVRLLNKMGVSKFLAYLGKEAGFAEIQKAKERLGLSAILGGCTVSMEELVTFYVALVNKGELQSLRWHTGQPAATKGKNIASPAAAWMVLDMLSKADRPDLPIWIAGASGSPRIAWKTGTSFGKKDAWAIGVTPEYTIGVWLGNFDGEGAPELSGAEMATPLLFDLFHALSSDNEELSWLEAPRTIGTRNICKETGLAAGPGCSSQTEDMYIRKVSSGKICNLHKEVYVNENESHQYCTDCLPPGHQHKKTFTQYDPELVLWSAERGIHLDLPPKHNDACESRFTGQGPEILSPSDDFEYLVESNTSNRVLLQAVAPADVSTLYWYIDNKLYRQAYTNQRIFYAPVPGTHTFTCMDDKGRKSSVTIFVKAF